MSVRLRHAIPLSLAILIIVLAVLGANMARITSYRKIEEMMVPQSSSLARVTAAILQQSEARQFPVILEELATLPSMMGVTVIAAGERSVPGEDRLDESIVDKARGQGRLQVELTADRATIVVAAPFQARGSQGEGLSVLLTHTDLTERKRQEMPGIIIRSATMSGSSLILGLLVWLYLRSNFTRRLQRLINALRTYSSDKRDWQAPIDGQGEVGEIARVVNRLFADLSDERTALQENAEKFARIFAHTPLLFSLSEVESGVFTEVNQEMIRVSGFGRDELMGKTSDEIGWMTPEDRARLLATLNERGRVDAMELLLRTKSGRTVECVLYGDIVTIAGKPHLLSIARDVSEERRAERALQRSEERFRRLFDGAADAVIVSDQSGHIVDANQVASRSLGYSHEELVQMSVRDLSSIRGREAKALWERILTKEDTTFEDTYRRYDGTTFPVEVRVAPLVLGDEPLFVAAARDVTERRHMEGTLLQSQKMEAVGQLAGGVAHDFNNTLTTTTITLDLLLASTKLDEETRAGLKTLEAQTKRATALTRQLLMFSRRTKLEVRILDVNDMVANLLKMVGRLLGEHIHLVFERCTTSPMVEADVNMLEQVLVNLCVNARDAMPRGGRITISIEVLGDVTNSAAQNDSGPSMYVCLSVADTGSGMDEGTQKRIFEPFFTTKEPGKGTGLGLATVHGIVTQHKGWIDVRSSLGKGSTFRVFLPQVQAARAVVDDEQPLPQGKGETILLVEDEPSILRVTARSLRKNGYEVREAANGPDALRLLRENNGAVDLLLSDMMMPGGLSGLDLIREVRTLWPAIKVMICSGYIPESATDDQPDAESIMRLQKPYSIKELAETLRRCLEEGQVS
jgi:PAS domain S-box-containing protein